MSLCRKLSQTFESPFYSSQSNYGDYRGERPINLYDGNSSNGLNSNLNDSQRKEEDSNKFIKVESLETLNFGKVFADHDETLLYIYYTMANDDAQAKSSKELIKRGWKFNEKDQTWYTTRTSPGKGGKGNKSKAHPNRRGEDNPESKTFKFDINQWNVVEIESSAGDA